MDVRICFFTNRVVNDLNSLHIKLVKAETFYQFKDRLDSHWRHKCMTSLRTTIKNVISRRLGIQAKAFQPVALVSRYIRGAGGGGGGDGSDIFTCT